MDFEETINSFEMEKRICYLIIYWTIIIYLPIFTNFSAILLRKIIFFDILIMVDFLKRFLLYPATVTIAKYWNSDRIKLSTGSVYVKYP